MYMYDMNMTLSAILASAIDYISCFDMDVLIQYCFWAV